jgi:fibrillarin-like pre-rRNA processing protein
MEKIPKVVKKDGRLLVENPIAGYRPFDDEIIKGRKEYRVWNPRRSKAAAAIVKGIKEFPIQEGNKVLYLGAAHGYTPSFISNIVGKDGIVYSVEFSERTFNKLLPVSKKYTNIIPILADARKPELYYWVEQVDVVYADVAQPDETRIVIRNCKEFLKKGGYTMIAIKSRSIDVTKSPMKVYQEEMKKLRRGGFEIIDWKKLDPLERAHAFILAKMD